MITTLFFDLDGTLLPMDLEKFTRLYLQTLGQALAVHGFDPKRLASNIMKGVAHMGHHDPASTNEEAFWAFFSSEYGPGILDQMPLFDAYYRSGFGQCQAACPINVQTASLIETAQKLGFRLILATNPIFPRIAVDTRIQWAGLRPEVFDYVTSYENSHFTKPDPRYFLETAKAAGVPPENILMIGNDLKEDYGALEAGMHLFILTDCLIPCEGRSLEMIPHGSFFDLERFLETIAPNRSIQSESI